MDTSDLLVIGGGVNGVGIARDAAGRGLSVVLCEKDDLASHTSSWSTKLIHGGLRYLEHYEFRLVRESLIEREVLLAAAPHLVSPLRFILPHHKGLRPAWLLRLGLFLYDHLGGRKHLPATTSVNLAADPRGAPLKDGFVKGFEYTDCRVDDSRLVVLNAMDAAARGAEILTRTRFVGAARDEAGWRCTLETADGARRAVQAKALVNAAGPWVNGVITQTPGVETKHRLRLVKGSHLITKRLYDHDRAYIFQNADGRIVFTIPYLNDTTLVGTTDEPYEGDPAAVAISEAEIDYLCAAASEYLKTPLMRDDVLATYSGVRPLHDDMSQDAASAVTRDYAFDVDQAGGATALSIYGGKLTTYRKLAEHALERLGADFPDMGPAWTAAAALPGGDMGYAGWAAFRAQACEAYGFLPGGVLERLLAAYGDRIGQVLGDAQTQADLGQDFGFGLTAREIDYLHAHEWAQTANDVLTRRTKLGWFMTETQKQAVADYMAGAKAPAAA